MLAQPVTLSCGSGTSNGYVLVDVTIVPEIVGALADEKPALVRAAAEAASGISDKLRDALVDEVEKNLAESWTRKKIFSALID